MRCSQRFKAIEERLNDHRLQVHHGDNDGERREPEVQPPAARATANDGVQQPRERDGTNHGDQFAFRPVPEPGRPALDGLIEFSLQMLPEDIGWKVQQVVGNEEQGDEDQGLDETPRGCGLGPVAKLGREFPVQYQPNCKKPIEETDDIEKEIAKLGTVANSALIVLPDNFTTVHRQTIIELVARWQIPAICSYRYFADEGGLLSYGVDVLDLFRRAPEYVDRILQGAKPADLPVQAPRKFELVINLKAANALGLVVPRIMLAGADSLIE